MDHAQECEKLKQRIEWLLLHEEDAILVEQQIDCLEKMLWRHEDTKEIGSPS